MPFDSLVSVCVPCYKYPQLLERCLNSIIEQTHTNIEIIITDDSPNDEIQQLIENHFVDHRICYYKNERQLGSPDNWNAGIALANGNYIKIMHHDDWFATKDALEIFVKTAEAEGADLVCSDCINNFPDSLGKHKINKLFRNNWIKDRSLILFSNFIGAPSVTFFKRYPQDKIYFDLKTIWFVDMLFYFDYFKSGRKVAFIDQFLINITAGAPTQITNSVINGNIVLNEFLYITNRLDSDQRKTLLYKITLLEILSKYNIRTKKKFKEASKSENVEDMPFSILSLPIPYRFFSVIKFLIIALK